ncbi:MAG: class I tRNA ligase family protein [Spirochaetales bacterium]|nr:class I tRNA ligase family protein [Spirochaetales bacterium]
MILYNTMSRSLKDFSPRTAKKVKIFTCGPSVYRRPHIGNYRTFLFEDLLVRYLEYLGHTVQRVINFTDIEDKTIEEAEEQGLTPGQLTDKVKEIFFRETAGLHIKLPDFIPSSSTSVNTAAEIIKKLMDTGYAYPYKQNIFFDPLKKKDFGKLAGLDMSKWPENRVRFKKDTYPGSRWNRGDFILWHGVNGSNSPAWDTIIGRGRPSWNIQDPAIISKHLGLEIDINCGGIDNLVRHHDYNIAIIEALSGREFANYYLHGAHLFVDGKKMSKSLGNIIYPDDLIRNEKDANALRYFLIRTHYRSKLNFTEKAWQKNRKKLEALQQLVDKTIKAAGGSTTGSAVADSIRNQFIQHMDNDLQAGLFLDELEHILAGLAADTAELARQAGSVVGQLKSINEVLQVFSFRP